MFSLSECIAWMTIYLAVSAATVTFNLCTIIVFIKSRNLRKRSTYLLINLAFVDMLVGGFSPYHLYNLVGLKCNDWKRLSNELWDVYTLTAILRLFCYASLTNIAIIALERTHATFFPFRHHVLKKWVHKLLIAAVWVTAALVDLVSTTYLVKRYVRIYLYLRVTFSSICLLIICASYTSILVKVRCGAQPQHHGATSRERKLTITLLMVTVGSLLLYLPHVIMLALFGFKSELLLSTPDSVFFAVTVLFYANSLVNPVLYTIRLQEYRSALLALVCKQHQRQWQVAVLPLHDV